MGTVEKGKLADLALLNANPLKDISNTERIRAEVANDQYFKLKRWNEMLAKAEQAANRQQDNVPKHKK